MVDGVRHSGVAEADVHYDGDGGGQNCLLRPYNDCSGKKANILLWDNAAKEFDVTRITNKHVFILTSSAVAPLRGKEGLFVMSKQWSNIFIDLDIAEASKLKESDMNVNLESMKKTNEVEHWKDQNRQKLGDVKQAFAKDGKEMLFTCRGRISKYVSVYDYLAHKQCHCKVDEVNGSFYCKKHGAITDFYQSGNIKLEIADDSGNQIVAVFNKQIEAMIEMDVETIIEYNRSNVNIADLFEEVINKEYIFELKVKSIGEMTMTMTKFEVVAVAQKDENQEKDNENEKRKRTAEQIVDDAELHIAKKTQASKNVQP